MFPWLGDFLAVINTVFQWTFGATTVELTGTFNNWENPIPLKKMENNCFEIILVRELEKNKIFITQRRLVSCYFSNTQIKLHSIIAFPLLKFHFITKKLSPGVY
jgi:hypothetical protein